MCLCLLQTTPFIWLDQQTGSQLLYMVHPGVLGGGGQTADKPHPPVSWALALVLAGTQFPWVHRLDSMRCTALHRTAPHRTAPHRTAPHRTAPHRTEPNRTAPRHTAPHRTAPHRAAPADAGAWQSHVAAGAASKQRGIRGTTPEQHTLLLLQGAGGSLTPVSRPIKHCNHP